MNKSKNRRNFLKLLLTGGAVAGVSATATGQDSLENEDKVTMLTEDGELVEVSRSALSKFSTGKKAGAEEVHNFIKPSSNEIS